MAAASAPPFAPPLKLSHFFNPNNKTPKLKFKLTTSNNNFINNPISRKRVSFLPSSISWSKSIHQRSTRLISRAYVSGPAFDAIVSENDPKINDTEYIPELLQPVDVISWGILWELVSCHKWRVLVSILTLLGCTSCTLAMPIYSGRFFEGLIGARPEPIWKLLSKVGILYTL